MGFFDFTEKYYKYEGYEGMTIVFLNYIQILKN